MVLHGILIDNFSYSKNMIVTNVMLITRLLVIHSRFVFTVFPLI